MDALAACLVGVALAAGSLAILAFCRAVAPHSPLERHYDDQAQMDALWPAPTEAPIEWRHANE